MIYIIIRIKYGELDFLIENKGEVLPIEVKSGKNYKKHNALYNILSSNEYNITNAYILSNQNVSVENNKIYLPIYMVMFFKKDEIKDMIYKIDLSDL